MAKRERVMSNHWGQKQMMQRLVKYRELRPCLNAFVDTYTPGSDQKENFTIIGAGVAESPDQHVHINEAHGFNIGGARQPPGCLNSQHSHTTEEVFVVHSGTWAFRWGDECQDGEAILQEGDCISIPVNVFRGFENVGEGLGFLYAVLGGSDAGNVKWAPDVFDKAEDYGLVLLENGSLVDTTTGASIPEGVAAMPRTSDAEVKAHRVMSVAEMLDCVCTVEEQSVAVGSDFMSQSTGLKESPIIGAANADEGIAAGKLSWTHGFQVRRWDVAAQGQSVDYSRQEEEVVFVHRGHLTFSWQDQGESHELSMEEGDVLTVPKGIKHHFSNLSDTDTVAYVTVGGNQPHAPIQ